MMKFEVLAQVTENGIDIEEQTIQFKKWKEAKNWIEMEVTNQVAEFSGQGKAINLIFGSKKHPQWSVQSDFSESFFARYTIRPINRSLLEEEVITAKKQLKQAENNLAYQNP